MIQNSYARFLAEAGINVISKDGIDWFEYNRFLRPAYLPHATPLISDSNAKAALHQSRCLFARWDSHFGLVENSPWWYLLRKAPYGIEQLSQNTRSKISRGRKRLIARPVTVDEMRRFGMVVCLRAADRYGTHEFTPEPSHFQKKLNAAELFPDTVNFFGVFSDDQLVGYSENHIQGEGVFLETIWYDPAYLGDYSSYLLTHQMLDYYLNQKNAGYVSDGCRSLYHSTNVQQFFSEKFGFIQQPALLQIVYKWGIQQILKTMFPMHSNLKWIRKFLHNSFVRKVDGLILQESIRRECQSINGPNGF